MTTKIIYDSLDTTVVTAIASATGVKVSGIVYPGIETATNPAGGETINLTGSGFQSTPNVIVNGTSAGTVTFISSTQISFTAPALSAGTYVIYVVNPDGSTAISIPGISYHGVPQWTTAAGSLGSVYEYSSISNTVVATSTDTVSYSLVSGTLPTGSTLNSSTGLISGTSPAETNATTFNFVIGATDAENQVTTRSFSLTINPDVVTWNSPSSGSTYNVYTNAAIANVTMSATSAAGQSITYTANSLPTGLSITGANIAGTPTVVGSSSTLLTATAANTGKTATSTINWVISVANDTYFPYVSLLLNGETATTSYIADASTNNFALTVNGTATPNRFSPLWGNGYYGVYFNGSSLATVPANTNHDFGTSDFTIEIWFNLSSLGQPQLLDGRLNGTTGMWYLYIINSSYKIVFGGGSADRITSNNSVTIGQWYHVAVSRISSVTNMYVNGVVQGTAWSDTTNYTNSGTDPIYIGAFGGGGGNLTGYISNLRLIKGTGLYTANFTPPTTPLTAVANTILLTCQNNNFVDNSSNAFTITPTGTVKIVPNQPFGVTNQNGYYSDYFDGSSGYLTISNNSAFDLGTADFTLEAWVYLTTLTPGGGGTSDGSAILSTYPSTGTITGYEFSINPSGYLGFGAWLSGTQQTIVATSNALTTNTWTHVAVSRASSTYKLFINGTPVTFSGSLTQATNTGGNSIKIGALLYTTYYDYLTGYISNLRVVKGTALYTSAFTPSTSPLTAITNTVLLTCQSSNFIDNSTNNFVITVNGSVSVSSAKVPFAIQTTGGLPSAVQSYGSSLFDGSTGYLNLGTNSSLNFGTNNFTVEFWVYPNTTSQNGVSVVLGNGNSTWSAGAINITLGSNVGKLCVAAYDYSSSNPNFLIESASFVANQWTHYAITRNGNTFTIYRNGISVATTTSFTGNINLNNNNKTFIGADQWDGSSGYFNGYISNLRIVNSVVYTTNFTPSTTPLTAIANTSLLTLQNKQGNNNNTFYDDSSSNLAITRNGTPTQGTFSPFSQTGWSNYFDGSTGYLTVPYNTAFDWATAAYTVEFWAYPTALATYKPLCSKVSVTNGTNDWELLLNSSGNVIFRYWTGSSQTFTSSLTIPVNAWSHIAFTYNGSTTLALYINGVAAGTFGYVATAAATAATPFQIGGAINGLEGVSEIYFSGYMSNLRIVKGTAVYTSAFTPSTTPLTAITNTTLLTCQSNRFVDNSSNNYAITLAGTVQVQAYGPFNSSASYSASTNGGSIYFNGSTDYLTAPSSAISLPGNFTVECWVYATTTTNSVDQVFNFGNYTFMLYHNGTTWTVEIGNGSSNYFTLVGSASLSAWHHFAITRNSNTYTLWIDGVSAATNSNNNAPAISSARLYIGQSATSGNNQYFTGYISNFRIVNGTAVYTSNFTPPTAPPTPTPQTSLLLLLGTNGGIIDQTARNDVITVGSSQVSTSIAKYGSGSMYFDGSSGYLVIPSNTFFDFGVSDFTIESWVYFSSFPSYAPIVTRWSPNQWYLAVWNGNSVHYYGNGNSILTASYSFSTGTWYHIALCRSAGTTRIFVNGSQAASGSDTTNYSAGTSPVTVGVTSTAVNTQLFNGYIDDLRITNGIARYTTAFTPPSSALITR